MAAILGIGAATLDRTYRAKASLVADTSNPVAPVKLAFGGVARNVVENLARLGTSTGLLSIVGDDENGRMILRHLQERGVGTNAIVIDAARRTAEYVAVLEPNGRLALGLADMSIFDAFIVANLDRARDMMAAAAWVFADCNLPAAVLAELLRRRRGGPFRLAVDMVSTTKAARLPRDLSGIDLLFANADEARAYLAASGPGVPATPLASVEALRAAGASRVMVMRGERGAVAAEAGRIVEVPGVPAAIVDVTGAGDAAIAATLAGLAEGLPFAEAARLGMLLGALTTETETSVRADLSRAMLADHLHRLPTIAAAVQ